MLTNNANRLLVSVTADVTSLLVFVLFRSNMETFNHRINTYFESWLGPRGKSRWSVLFTSGPVPPLQTVPADSAGVTRSHCGRKRTSDHVLHLCPDQRVRGWLLLDHYPTTFALTVVYLLIVWLGPKYMKHRQPYSCRGAMMIYNLGLTLLSFYMFYEVSRGLSPPRVVAAQRCARDSARQARKKL